MGIRKKNKPSACVLPDQGKQSAASPSIKMGIVLVVDYVTP